MNVSGSLLCVLLSLHAWIPCCWIISLEVAVSVYEIRRKHEAQITKSLTTPRPPRISTESEIQATQTASSILWRFSSKTINKRTHSTALSWRWLMKPPLSLALILSLASYFPRRTKGGDFMSVDSILEIVMLIMCILFPRVDVWNFPRKHFLLLKTAQSTVFNT